MKKKILSLMLAMVMMLSLSVTALAADDNTSTTTYTDMSTVTISKEYTLTNEGTTSPAETFTLEQVGSGVVTDGDADSAPDLVSISRVAFATGAAGSENKTGTFTITLPTYNKVGVYEYTLQETAGTTAGVTYRTSTIKLVVTVIEQSGLVRVAAVHCENEDGEKTSTFSDNTYSAGSLSISKTVTGNLGDKDKEFEVTVTFTAPEDERVLSTISYTVGATTYTIDQTEWSTDGTVSKTINISNGDTVTFSNIPYGVTYQVSESDDAAIYDGYDAPAYSGDEDDTTTYTQGTKTDNEIMTIVTAGAAFGEIDDSSDAITITNNKTGEVDTGISLDSLPYILMLIVVAAGAVVMISRRRLDNRF